jgi:hypothetical protein
VQNVEDDPHDEGMDLSLALDRAYYVSIDRSVEDILRQGQRDGELRDFDVSVVGGVMRSAITHAMVMRQREDPGADLGAYAEELVRLFDLGIRR